MGDQRIKSQLLLEHSRPDLSQLCLPQREPQIQYQVQNLGSRVVGRIEVAFQHIMMQILNILSNILREIFARELVFDEVKQEEMLDWKEKFQTISVVVENLGQ